MTSRNETLLSLAIAVVCLVGGIVCYGVIPAKAPEVPVRVMFDSVGGKVLFDHQTHSSDYNLDCKDCHHSYVKGQPVMPGSCDACHKKDSEYRPALGKKGFFDHEAHKNDYGLDCSECHHDYVEGKPGGLEPCTDCHLRNMEDDSIPDSMDAFHQQCIGCHEDQGVSPGKNDCSGCHTPRKTMEAYHGQCIGCHDDLGVGPVKADCKTCHAY